MRFPFLPGLSAQFALAGLLLLGSCQTPKAPQPSPETGLRLVSYNIKHGQGQDAKIHLERTAQVLEAQDADVILLQEVDKRCERSFGVDQAQWLADRLGMHARFTPFMEYQGGHYGLAILSRYSILNTLEISLPPGLHEPRSALMIQIAAHQRNVRITNVHFDWLDNDEQRLLQAQSLYAKITEQSRAAGLAPDDLWIIGGDFNDLPDSNTLKTFTQKRPAEDPQFERIGPGKPTFPSNGPHKLIDHFLLFGAKVPTQTKVIDEPLASEHCPVVVDLSL